MKDNNTLVNFSLHLVTLIGILAIYQSDHDIQLHFSKGFCVGPLSSLTILVISDKVPVCQYW